MARTKLQTGKQVFHATMWPELKFARVDSTCWSFYSVDEDGSKHRVGPLYPTKTLLLADMYRYAKDSWGLE